MAREPPATISDFHIDANVQMSGYLWKMPTSGRISRWLRRYCVLKDGFFLYYAVKPADEDAHDPHVKGVVPLGGSQVAQAEGEPKRGLTGCAFVVTHPSVGARSLALGAATAEERDRTFANALRGAAMIEKLRSEGRHVTAQLEVLANQIQAREEQLVAEIGQRGALEEVVAAMSEDKRALEERVQELLQARAAAKAELLETSASVEEATAALHAATVSNAGAGVGGKQRDDGGAAPAQPGATTDLAAERARLEAEVAAARRERAELQSTLADLESRRAAEETASERATEASIATQRELGEAQEALSRLVATLGAEPHLAESVQEEIRVLRKFVRLREDETVSTERKEATASLASAELQAIRQRTRTSRAVFRAAERRASVMGGGAAEPTTGPLAGMMRRKPS